MFTNKKNLIKLTAGIGLSAAMLLTGSVSGQAFQSQIVEASSSYKVRLKHNAYVYNHKGKKARKAPLKKGKTLKVYKSNKIKGKKYLYLGKNQYVKAGNATTLKHKKGLFEATITSGGQIFRAPNQEPTDYYALLQVNVLEEHADSNGTI